MKNALTPTQGTAAVSEPWRRGAADVRRRPAAPRRRRAHAPRLRHRRGRAGRLGDRERARPRPRSTTRSLRRWAARLSQRGAAPRTMARKLASIRSLFRSLLEHGEVASNPADLLPAPRAAADAAEDAQARTTSPRCSSASRPRTPLEQRDRALFELAYAQRPARRGARRPRRRRASTSTPSRCASRARAPRPASCPPASRRCESIAAYLERARPALAGADAGARAVPLQERPAALHVRRPAPPAGVGAARRDADRRAPARPPALLRHPPARGRRGPARDPGDARPREHLDDPGLHSGRVRPAAGGVREEPPAGVKGPLWRPTSKRSS